MNQSRFNEKIDITRGVDTTDSDGFTDPQWNFHLEKVPCKIKWSTGAELMVEGRITSSRDAIITCAILDIKVKDRIQFDSELYDIVSVTKPQNRFMQLKVNRNPDEDLI